MSRSNPVVTKLIRFHSVVDPPKMSEWDENVTRLFLVVTLDQRVRIGNYSKSEDRWFVDQTRLPLVVTNWAELPSPPFSSDGMKALKHKKG